MAVRTSWKAAVAVAAAAALPVAAVAWLRAGTAGSRLPERGTTGERVPGLEAPAEVRIDAWGIPHVAAATVRDAWLVEGYLHARERFFQMELARRAAAGRLAELLGEGLLPQDRKLRTWRLAATARAQAARLAPGEREALEAYAAGVNAAIGRWGRWLAPELVILGVGPEPWRVEDTLGLGLIFELGVSHAMGEELQRGAQLALLGRERALELWGWPPEWGRRFLPRRPARVAPRAPDDAVTPPLGALASNNWALAPSRTATGRPLLANDPHLAIQLPSAWYPVHLTAPGLDVAGVSLPGAPGVMIGHTDGVAWGFTMAMLDDQDLFVVRLDPAGRREWRDGRWRDLQVVRESIAVAGREEPVTLEVRISRFGPLVRVGGGHGLALSWTALEGPSPVAAFLRLDRARTVEEAEAAWRGAVGPGMNLVAADTRGHILHRVVGEVPLRAPRTGRVPTPAESSRVAWRGLRPMDRNPRTLDPPEGFLATANHDPFAEGMYPESQRFPGEFAAPWRYRRIRERLAARTDWDVEDTLALQMDVVSGRARAVLVLLGPDLAAHGGPTARALLAWDGAFRAGQREPLLYTRLVTDLAAAASGDEARRLGLERPLFGPAEVLRLLAGAMGESWWDDVTTPQVETRRDIVRRVLDRLDRDPPAGRWGDVHRDRFRHPLARAPLVGPLFEAAWSRGPLPAPGDGTTVNAHYWSRSHPYEVAAIPSMRFVADVGAWDRSVLVVPPGASGRPWSAHYDDQLVPWHTGGAVPLPFGEEAVRRLTRATLVLTPGAE